MTSTPRRRLARLANIVLAVLATAATAAMWPALASPGPAYVALIIDDLGQQHAAGERAIALPGPVACAVLPGTPASRSLAYLAHANGKEVLLHQPLQPVDPAKDPGPRAILLDMNREALGRVLTQNLAELPWVVGINTHMGSLVTREPQHMQWFMQEIVEQRPMFFIDSFTTRGSRAYPAAREHGIRALRRDVFLDTDPSPEAIAGQFQQLIDKARQRGHALGIGHPYPETMAFLETALPTLREHGIQLISLGELLDHTGQLLPRERRAAGASPAAGSP